MKHIYYIKKLTKSQLIEILHIKNTPLRGLQSRVVEGRGEPPLQRLVVMAEVGCIFR
jgi:hypothetical protein